MTDHAAKIWEHIEAFNLLFHPDSTNGFDEAALSHLDTIQQYTDALQAELNAERARVEQLQEELRQERVKLMGARMWRDKYAKYDWMQDFTSEEDQA